MKKIISIIILITLLSAGLASATVTNDNNVLSEATESFINKQQNQMNPLSSDLPTVTFYDDNYDVLIGESFIFTPSIVTIENADIIQWFTTNGGGQFDDENAPHPTYFPSPTIDYPQGYTIVGVVVSNQFGSSEGFVQLNYKESGDPPVIIFNDDNYTVPFDQCFTFSESIVTIENAQYVQWFTTNGGGVFDDETIPHPTYCPSPVIDYPQGYTIIGVAATNDFCSETKFVWLNYNDSGDSPTVIISSENYIIPLDECFTFSDDIVTIEGASFIQWYTTNGGGVFDDETISHPTYCPSPVIDYPQGYTTICVAAANPYGSSEGFVQLVYEGSNANLIPEMPDSPSPAHNSNNVELTVDLSWTGGDPLGLDVTYDVYFGTTNPPPKESEEQSETTFSTTLSYSKTYYWKVIAWNTLGESCEGPVWSFTTKNKPTPSYTPPTKNPPVAHISADETYQAFVNDLLEFDGSKSYGQSGADIISWDWDFGDGTSANGKTVSHSYKTAGTYTITLTVTDDNDKTDEKTVKAIIKTPNQPPSKPQITGPRNGQKDTQYDFSFVSTDSNNDDIQYMIEWGDDSPLVATNFEESSTKITVSHAWAKPGIYTVSVIAQDGHSSSESSTFTMLIDVKYVGDIGYIIDSDGDGVYDSFYNYRTDSLTGFKILGDGAYLIDETADGQWDYIYNPSAESLSAYVEPEKDSAAPIIPILTPGILIALFLLFLVVLVFIRYRNKQVQAKNK